MENTDDTALRRGLLQILEEAMQLEGADFGKIRVARPDSRTLEIAVQLGFSERFVEAFREITPDDDQPSARAVRTRRRITLPDLARQPADHPFVAAVRDEGVRAMQVTPIVAPDGDVVGCLSTCYRQPCTVTTASALVLDHHARRAATLIKTWID